jgi:hypothetical protein
MIMGRPSLDKIAFVLSVAVLAFVYGVATQAFGWPPSSFLQRVWSQATASIDAPWLPGNGDAHGMYGRAPRVYEDRSGVRIVDRDAVQPGLTLIATRWADFGWDPGLKLVDPEGRVVHEWRVDGDDVFPEPPEEHVRKEPSTTGIHGVQLLSGGDVLVNLDYVGTARIGAYGDVEWRLPEGSHHSIARAEDGSFWIAAGTYEPPDDPVDYPGIDPEYWSRILHVSEDGEILDEIRVLDLLYRNDLERHLAKGSFFPPRGTDRHANDLIHLNDAEPLPSSMAAQYPGLESGDLVVSLHHLDLIFILDPESERVKWHASKPFIQQHDPDFLGDGWIGVFDNNRDGTERGEMLGGSRIVALQPHTDSTEVLFPTAQSDPFYTDVQGKWQHLDNGNLLLTESQAGRIVEVAPDGGTVWEWVHAPYDDSHVPEVSEGTRYDLTSEQVRRWPCSSREATPEETGQEAGG